MKNGMYSDASGVYWYKDDIFHREDGPAVELSMGSKLWYVNGVCHRLNGPAIEYQNGGTEWWVSGKRHRVDGPAMEYASGAKEWFIRGTKVDISLIEYDGSRHLTDEEITYLLLCA